MQTTTEPAAAPTAEQCRAEADMKIRKALALIERAQNDLSSACAELSAITYGCPVWKATSGMTDKVHALWYRVHNFRMRGKFGLDSMNTEALARRLASPPSQ